jgi:7-alpha-hydroxysteroid dehydrogenase
MSFSIAGKTAIVTGAANGIGLSIARHFADQGANVMCADMDEARLQEELGQTVEEGNARYFAGDLRERLTVANLISATLDAFDQIDILVNGARQVIETDPFDPEDTSVEVLLEQNLMTPLKLTQQVAKKMIKLADGKEGPVGTIVNLSCITPRATRPELMGYSIAVAALEQMTRSMALAYAPHRIRVNALAFGSVTSASLQQSFRDNPDWREDVEGNTPLGRVAAPTELVETVRFLASEASSFMTGEVVTVDGGRSLLDVVRAPAH